MDYPTRLCLTPQVLESLPPGADSKRRSYYDTIARGLVLRVGGPDLTDRVWYFEYSLANKTYRMRLGDLSEKVTLSKRRDEARVYTGQVTKARNGEGPHPLEVKRQKDAERRLVADTETFGELGKRALKDLAKQVRPKTLAEWERLFKKHLEPSLGEVAANDSAAVRSAVLAMTDKLGKTVGSNRCFELARRIMSFGVETDRSERYTANPLLRMPRPLREEPVRDRVLDGAEIRGVVTASVGTVYEDLIPLLLATGTRAGECLAAEWEEFSDKTWTIPGDKSKIGVARPVHLNEYALATLERIQAKVGDTGFLFLAASKSGHLERQTKVIRKILAASGVKDFGLHDLRRVVRVGLDDLAVATDVAELALGHLPSKLTRTYAPYPSFWKLAEQRKAMDRWGAELERILAGETRGKVLQMAGR